MPEPAIAPSDEPCSVLVTGIGGTGVVTVGRITRHGGAPRRQGCSMLDMTGLAQKNGAVSSHVRIARDPGVHARDAHRAPARPTR